MKQNVYIPTQGYRDETIGGKINLSLIAIVSNSNVLDTKYE